MLDSQCATYHADPKHMCNDLSIHFSETCVLSKSLSLLTLDFEDRVLLLEFRDQP